MWFFSSINACIKLLDRTWHQNASHQFAQNVGGSFWKLSPPEQSLTWPQPLPLPPPNVHRKTLTLLTMSLFLAKNRTYTRKYVWAICDWSKLLVHFNNMEHVIRTSESSLSCQKPHSLKNKNVLKTSFIWQDLSESHVNPKFLGVKKSVPEAPSFAYFLFLLWRTRKVKYSYY